MFKQQSKECICGETITNKNPYAGDTWGSFVNCHKCHSTLMFPIMVEKLTDLHYDSLGRVYNVYVNVVGLKYKWVETKYERIVSC